MTRSGPPGAGVRQRNNCGRNCLREWGQTKFKFAIFMASGKSKIMGVLMGDLPEHCSGTRECNPCVTNGSGPLIHVYQGDGHWKGKQENSVLGFSLLLFLLCFFYDPFGVRQGFHGLPRSRAINSGRTMPQTEPREPDSIQKL